MGSIRLRLDEVSSIVFIVQIMGQIFEVLHVTAADKSAQLGEIAGV